MRRRLRVLFGVMMLAVLAGLSLATPMAGAEPRTVAVAVHELSPFVVKRGDLYSGFTIDVWDEIAKREQWATNFIDVANVRGQLAAVSDGRADVAAGAISITKERMQSFDFSQPILNSGLQIMVPLHATQPTQLGLLGFLKLLFSKTMLIWLLAGAVLAVLPAHIIWWVERQHSDPMVSHRYFPGIFQSFDWGTAMLAGQPDSTPKHWLARALATLWAFVSIIFVAYYTATLTANMTAQKFNAAISSPSDLVGRRVATVANTTSSDFLSSAGVQATEMSSIDDCFKALKSGKFDAVVFDAPVLQYFVANDGASSAVLAGAIFQPEDYGLAFRPGDQLRRQSDEALLGMREDGTYAQIKKKWFGNGETAGSG